MTLNFRKIHRKAAPILFLPLLLAAITGILYRLSRSWFGASFDTTGFLLVLHQGEFLGETLSPFYVLLMGIGLLGMVISGLTLIRRKRKPAKALPKDKRWWHRVLAIAGFLPLTISAVTGIAYRLGQSWFGISPSLAGTLMQVHQGAYLGSVLQVVYVLLVGLGLVGLLITGINMTGIFRKRKAASGSST